MGKRAKKAADEAERERRAAPVLALIERAFDGAPVPDQDHRTLFQAEAWDGYQLVDRLRDHEGRWQDLPARHIRACQNALPHLDEQGIQYYLPAIMWILIRNPGKDYGQIRASLGYTLRPSTGELKDHQCRRFRLLTPLQRQAILAFLQFLEEPEEDLEPWRRVVACGDDPRWFRKFY